MDLQLKDKQALVTGSTAGIGFAIATALAKEGAHVILSGRSQSRLDVACERLRKQVPGAVLGTIAADLGTAAGCSQVTREFPDLDILVNNVGIFDPRPFEEISDDEWQHMTEVNVMSGVRLSRHYVQGMKARNWGRIVFISSESGINIPAEMVHYGMTKAAQLAVTRGIAETTVGTAVTVNAVLPGPTRTEGVGEFFAKLAKEQGASLELAEKDFFAFARPSSLLKRFIDPAEVASLVAYICSPLAAATNGAALRAEGGIVRSIA
ncbi:MAG TPA: SDR family oxidoreductase [Rhodocyclaceae bacterium]|jgi:NAD(P)-dependent dehydrogenase (short-subunit alcohol dehydrogenase family)